MACIIAHHGTTPCIAPTAFVAPNATLIGDVQVGAGASIWFGAVLRGDLLPIHIGARTSVQDLCMLHTTTGWQPTTVGEDCTVGHAVLLHGCSIADRVLIGMGSIVLDEAHVESDTLIGAGSLIASKTRIPSGVLAFGRPAKVVRDLRPEEVAAIRDSANRYLKYAASYG